MNERLSALWAEALRGSGPLLIALVGSNGAGKSTYYRANLRELPLPFLNADERAKQIRPADPESVAYEAMYQIEAEREAHLAARHSFIMETVLSDPRGAKIDFLRRARSAGFTLVVIAIRISDIEVSRSRVMQRVAEGGHDVPDDKLASRFGRTQTNVPRALALAHLGLVLDNSSAATPYRLVECWLDGKARRF